MTAKEADGWSLRHEETINDKYEWYCWELYNKRLVAIQRSPIDWWVAVYERKINCSIVLESIVCTNKKKAMDYVLKLMVEH